MVYLEKPNTAIEWVEGANQSKQIRYSAGEMQGWRLNMVSTLTICSFLTY